MRQIGTWMLQALRKPDDGDAIHRIRQDVAEFVQEFPVPADAVAAV